MLDIQVTVEGEKIIIEGLESLGDNIRPALQRALAKMGKGIHREAYDFLSGPGAKGSNAPAGGYPVPVRTGTLRRLLDWLEPGETKTVGAMYDWRDKSLITSSGTFSAGPMEAMVYDSAEYARVIHEGTHTSREYGRRPFLEDALEKFNSEDRIRKIFEGEIKREIKKSGLS